MFDAATLPVIFAGLMGLAILLYVILDGYDLGVGMLMARVERPDRDRMVASIGPFWDANETWLVLGIGLLLVAFPMAHGMVLTALYLPVALMLLGLTLRGVAFEFRVKARPPHQKWWDRAFIFGSTLSALTQGYMLGRYVLGFRTAWEAQGFALLSALGLAAAYVLVGACWLIAKTEGDLQARAVAWAKRALVFTGLGMVFISAVTPMVSDRIFVRWFSFPNIIGLLPIPLMTAALFLSLWVFLRRMPRADHSLDIVPFLGASSLFVLGFFGLAYSFWPYVVPERLTIWEAASAPESLWIILMGAVFVLPMIIGYTVLSYWVFRGKASELHYD
ncbi:cytochrome d ubiquinol oxidase subunit II [Neogemmobacter tilapiae]|uniref:Cytochrome bd ubiquinol oxidase subunit II n=1 Tax=Neogemmobacter tilapiae TaxID=875041 RepID=A0A918TFY6_9RHOB|nr:cytochrome d ubiquinol oxidase subunit II [Gemmobacter tilapiae]GHC45946.1 cytochrome bd ubiquinol oxidase subunit II [Gemmobacter tilapiae]